MDLQTLAGQIRQMREVYPRAAATLSDVTATERRLGMRIPTELREFWLVMNGCEGSTPHEHGFVTFWPLERWQTVAALGLDGARVRAVVFADHSLSSWHFAFEVGDADQGARIIRVDGSDRIVCETFLEFLRAVVADDSLLYR